jgi:hypothetical protein
MTVSQDCGSINVQTVYITYNYTILVPVQIKKDHNEEQMPCQHSLITAFMSPLQVYVHYKDKGQPVIAILNLVNMSIKDRWFINV